MTDAPKTLFTIAFSLCLALGLGLGGCKKSGSDSNAPGEQESHNLCTEYTTCNACIEGQMAKGKTLGEAQTQCGAAVTGCWTTWEKPITCGEQSYEQPPE